jgi:DNA-binding HxlR family transcriptional regulator
LRVESECQDDICEILQILGGKWALPVMNLLNQGSKRFNQLKQSLGTFNNKPISTRSLTNTLRHLEKNQLIQRKVFPTVPVTVEYSLSEKGKEFGRLLGELQRLAAKWHQESTTDRAIQN